MFFRKKGFLLMAAVVLLGTVWYGRVVAANEESVLPRVDTAPSMQSVHIKNTESMVVVFVVPPEKSKT